MAIYTFSHDHLCLFIMSKKKKSRFYVVWKGAMPGIYTSWKECQAQIAGFPGARYRAFDTRNEAEYAFRVGANAIPPKSQSGSSPVVKPASYPKGEAITVDAACSGNPGPMEYRAVHLPSKKQLFTQGPYPDGTNNIGEFLGIVHALAWMQKHGVNLPIYSDSKIAIGWVARGQCRTKVKPTSGNAILFDVIKRAENWLETNNFRAPILKWETKAWGEIPADFGRKG